MVVMVVVVVVVMVTGCSSAAACGSMPAFVSAHGGRGDADGGFRVKAAVICGSGVVQAACTMHKRRSVIVRRRHCESETEGERGCRQYCPILNVMNFPRNRLCVLFLSSCS
jgi:hypothetical protein